MSELDNRKRALEAAVHLAASDRIRGDQVLTYAASILTFLEGTQVTTAEASEAPKASGRRKAAAPEKSAVTTVEPATPAVQAPATEAVAATATSPSKEPTLDDVRAALVALQTRKGTKAPAQTILEKYSPTQVTGGVPKDKYAALIAECAAA